MEEIEKASEEKLVEDRLDTAGYGSFHVILVLVAGIAAAADSVEIFGVSFVLPVADKDLDLSTALKGYLDASIFMGMFIGSYVWGSLADVFGRKRTLLMVTLLNALCSAVAAFSPNFLFFFFLRVFSGIAVGGSIPVSYTYLAEFYTEKRRGMVFLILIVSWSSGIVYAAFLAWGLLGTEIVYTTIDFYIGSLHFASWRLFLIMCTFPACLFALLLSFMPETPAYLYQDGQIEAMKKVLIKIQRINSVFCCCCWIRPNANISASNPIALHSLQLDPGVLHPDPDANLNADADADHKKSYPDVNPGKDKSKNRIAYRDSNLDATDPYNDSDFDNLDAADSDPDTSQNNESAHPNRSHRFSCHSYAKLTQVIRTLILLFKLKYLRATILLIIIYLTVYWGIYGLVLWFPENFKRRLESICNETTSLLDETGSAMSMSGMGGGGMDGSMDEDCMNSTNLQFYQDTLYTAIATLPGALSAIVLIELMGGKILLVVSCGVCALSVFLIWGIPTSYTAMVGVSSLFSATTVMVFGTTPVVIANVYDSTVRGTAMGIIFGCGRIGAIFGNLMFGYLLDVDSAIPILIVASLLTVAMLASIFLPNGYRTENIPPLIKTISKLKYCLHSRLCKN